MLRETSRPTGPPTPSKYDGDNRLVAFDAPLGTDSDTTYAYDGEGRRVRKVVGGSSGVATTYVYNVLRPVGGGVRGHGPRPAGHPLPHPRPPRQHPPRDRRRPVGPLPPRLPALRGGDRRRTYGTGTQASGVSGYTPSRTDGPTQKFTGKERDAESGLDYFGARYFGGAAGRFTSADAPLVDQFAADPGSWNLYTYTRNNPLRFIDPTGRTCVANADGTYSDVEGPGGTCEDALRGDVAARDDPDITVTPEEESPSYLDLPWYIDAAEVGIDIVSGALFVADLINLPSEEGIGPALVLQGVKKKV